MNLLKTSAWFENIKFRAWRRILSLFQGGEIGAFGTGDGRIGMILVINLDRHPRRLRRTFRELGRFRTSDGVSLITLTQRLAAVDARDGREVAATGDVDQAYVLGDQLYVQPDSRLEECFGPEEPVRMTRQEVAVARSHIEAWKLISTGPKDYVLVLEDDIWFNRGAAAAINRGWRAAQERCAKHGGPQLLYFSYSDAGGTAERKDVCDALFRPKRGLWFLSGYVLSREGARSLLEAMPVVGPVDMWINYRFEQLGALALTSPVILQRTDSVSDNSYSILPYLARAGIVDSDAVKVPARTAVCPVLAWTAGRDREGLAMALSMLGLRVRAFDGSECAISKEEMLLILRTYDALVDPPLSAKAISEAVSHTNAKFLFESGAVGLSKGEADCFPPKRAAILPNAVASAVLWRPLCALLDLPLPVYDFPVGPPREWRAFRDDRGRRALTTPKTTSQRQGLDDSAWALIPENDWPSPLGSERALDAVGVCLLHASMTAPCPVFSSHVETFPGNLAKFSKDGLTYDADGTRIVLNKAESGARPYISSAFASLHPFGHGRFQAQIRAARCPGLVTGFFLHRDGPRQEIDIELTGDDPSTMLANVYFNPGDDGALLEYGYRGSPCRVELGFDASTDFHLYAIDWRPGLISWSVDGKVVHRRVGWDPTPIPHLPMRLHANLWAPRSEEIAGGIDERAFPVSASFKNVSIWN